MGAGYRADMTTVDPANQASSMPTSRKLLCVVYGAIAVAALIATFSQMVPYADKGAGSLLAFWRDARVVEGRKQGIKFVWLYVAASYAIAISAAFPAFLIAREIRMGKSDTPGLRAIDTVLLAVVATLTALLTIWIDLG
jgi:hypothetical protein